MMNFKEWLSCHSISKSLLSTRPFSFFYDESSEREFWHHGTMDMVTGATISSERTLSENQVNVSSAHEQSLVTEASALAQYNSNKGNKDPLTQVEAFQLSFLRLVQRIGQSPANPVVLQVLYRLELASLIRAAESNVKKPGLKIDKAKALALALEESGHDDIDFSLKILVLGKTGVGKSATVNSLFDEAKVTTNAFRPSTEGIQQVVGTIKGIKVTFIDTPGLLPSNNNQRRNRKILIEVRKFIRKSPPDVILYFERLDFFDRIYYDFPLLKLITNVFGSSIWFNTILVMTHSSSPLPEGMDGYPVSYEEFVGQRTKLLQSYIHQAVSNTQLENPVLLAENHPMCMKNSKGEKVLPNGQAWLSQLLLLSISTKVLGDANSLLKFQNSFQFVKSDSIRQPSLPHLLSSLLQPRSTGTNIGGNDFQVDDLSDGEEDEYDQLPPIRILTKAQYQQLSRLQKNAYLDELDYRETLYLKKQWRAEIRRNKERLVSNSDASESSEYENSSSHEVVQLPDMAIPLSFDSNCPSHRYRWLLGTNEWLLRPVLDSQGWDHDVCFDGISLDFSKQIKGNLTASVAGQMRKDKVDFSIQSDSGVKFVHGKYFFVSAFDILTAGKALVCTFRGDFKFKNLNCNSTGCGVSLTSFGKMHFIGAKLEDSISLGKRFKLVANTGRLVGNSQETYGGSVEATIRGKDFPVRDEKVTVAANFLTYDKDMVLGGSFQTDFRVGRVAKMSFNANMNSRSLGQISFKVSTSEHFELGLITAVSLIQALFHKRNKSHEWEKT
ncbi:translocase of chloroplast 90, chloroplastic isoform X2 [Dendrobium catenatum]|uniref:Translocase of chloroplast 90, chloroplastic n=1 Tax=Dendrobium catenatum TaxID=906689 RepID=A0A2I0WRS2_9ASPA|nr:translocase of chloroplast 90, chloroplastic isoform X2 [Dendrobium catenatum]PKU78356.1 Translocase of chloroplast 90, chloroplastic [Dendrobium catenatum]